MGRTKQANRSTHKNERRAESTRRKNSKLFLELSNWFVPEGELFPKDVFHGNVKWKPEQLAMQALIWSWQETKYVTDAFDHTREVCDELGLRKVANSYTSLINAIDRYREVFSVTLRKRYQRLAQEVGGRHFKKGLWVPIAFDGSRVTAPRSVSNEQAFCAPNYGKGKRAKYGKKKSKGMRRKRIEANRPHPQAPQAWITMLWHMGTRLPWTWRLGPSNSSERDHVKEILLEEEFPKNTLFVGDAGFVGYPLWSMILSRGGDFLVRVGANVNLLSEQADVKKLGGGIVLCWPKGKMNSGQPPLSLRLVQVKVNKTKMWMLTSVLEPNKLTRKQIIQCYKMRWGIEVEYRGLKQTIDKQTLRCRMNRKIVVSPTRCELCVSACVTFTRAALKRIV